jgi:hypothetical protein
LAVPLRYFFTAANAEHEIREPLEEFEAAEMKFVRLVASYWRQTRGEMKMLDRN